MIQYFNNLIIMDKIRFKVFILLPFLTLTLYLLPVHANDWILKKGLENQFLSSTMMKIGHNSFTKEQIEKRLRDHGFNHIKHLLLDPDGIWRALISHNGHNYKVSIDYSGDIFVEQ
ncbi:hypothetical protein [Bartonella tamiae]|uniref:PepSY domain-containing protein n=1 Tax=Bartonella tamiae Th239 TaxID=1094558 RepID=J0R3U1_9HYPH|nr:hypothetical protein [Bartonella tamiae]EJF90304.1 hypothetical protein ME5_00705 [Bartonella tamiae Th239]EJF93755.1 hypothetical protein MEG_01179 [Bartonella tamiae Th307]